MNRILANHFVRCGLIIAAGVLLTILVFPNFFQGLLRSDEFMPHATCYLRNPKMILLHVSSDLIIGISYVCISTTLAYLVWKASRDIPFHWMFLAFGLFIVTCGFTHFMEVWTVWQSVYWLAGYVKLICAAASAATALALFPLVPKIIALVSALRVSEERRSKLEIANQDLEAFAYSVSHDLRAPLRTIQGFSAAVREDFQKQLPPEAQNYLQEIAKSSKRMEGLIQDMLQYGRISRSELELYTVHLDDVIGQATRELQADIEAARAEIKLDASLPRVKGNSTLLTQVFVNLVSNAIKFVPDGVAPQVQINAEHRGERVRVAVLDNGIGVPAEYHDKIFGVFERLHPADKYPGTGIGLAIVQKAVLRMGGRSGVESRSEGGSCFWIELPSASNSHH